MVGLVFFVLELLESTRFFDVFFFAKLFDFAFLRSKFANHETRIRIRVFAEF